MRLIFNLIATICISTLFIAPSADAQSKTKQLDRAFLIVASNPEALKERARSMGFKGKHVDVVADHLAKLLINPTIRKAVVKKLAPTMRLNANGTVVNRNQSRSQGLFNVLVSDAAFKGLRRMTPESQVGFFRAISPMFEKANTKDCAYFFSDGVNVEEDMGAEMRGQQSLTPSELSLYYKYIRVGADAEFGRKGRKRKLNRSQKALVEQVLYTNMQVRLGKHKNARGIEAVWNGQSNRPKDVCDAGRLTMRSLLDIKGDLSGLAGMYFLSQK